MVAGIRITAATIAMVLVVSFVLSCDDMLSGEASSSFPAAIATP
jgi:hypothetical protein